MLTAGRASKTVVTPGCCKPPVKAFAAGAKGLAITNRKFSIVSAISGLNPRSQQVAAQCYVKKERSANGKANGKRFARLLLGRAAIYADQSDFNRPILIVRLQRRALRDAITSSKNV